MPKNSINKDEQDGALSLKLFVVLSRAAQSVRKQVEEDIKSYGLNPTEFAVMELLYHKGEQPVQKIGEKVLIASSSITYVVDKLEKKHYVERKPCPSDRRVTFVHITPEGSSLLDSIFPQHEKRLQELFSQLDADQKIQLSEQLKDIGLYAQKA
ncbi:MarR family winged helix-turn-helix transcriptional regulator [Lacticigenium naphthae]|uniref:MarR family winged helix-turn-helix transcriptional regulator n=1 Tax=Lacticigenium naphthae TaxID=515351 RepID=UPI000409C65C|nr:MarR family transcriptional regulator [Lacticigenium naphthae]